MNPAGSIEQAEEQGLLMRRGAAAPSSRAPAATVGGGEGAMRLRDWLKPRRIANAAAHEEWCGGTAVVRLSDLPRPDGGAPLPVVVSAEHKLFVAYICDDADTPWEGPKGPRIEPIAIATFHRPHCHTFGPPSEDTLPGHPHAPAGLEPCAGYEVLASPWIEELARLDAVDPHHKRARFRAMRHFILTFHDSTFECAAEGYSVETFKGDISEAGPRMVERLEVSN